MRIAFTSYEYPVETGGGGIGTYLQTVSKLLHEQGNSVVVFTATDQAHAFWENDWVYRVPAKNWKTFNDVLPDYFLPIHQSNPFDVLEATDFQACGLTIKRSLPTLPMVVRLHTPLYMVDLLMYKPLSLRRKLRFILGALKKGQFPSLPSAPNQTNYKSEFDIIEVADIVSSPSRSIAEEMMRLGFNLTGKTEVVPLPFEADFAAPVVLARPALGNSPVIVFIGRLEVRKGVIELSKAIPVILKRYPEARFVFVGAPSQSPVSGVDMISYLQKKLEAHKSSVTFTGKVSREKVLSYLNEGDVFVFPSHYESFGLVCCEAMAAGKAVIGSSSGGMAEIIEDNKSGILIEPKRPKVIAKAVIQTIENEQMQLSLGKAAQERIANLLSPSCVLKQQIAVYQKAIDSVDKRFI